MPTCPQACEATQISVAGHVPWPSPWQQTGHCSAVVETQTPLQHRRPPGPPLQSRAVWLLSGAVPQKPLRQVLTRHVGSGIGQSLELSHVWHSPLGAPTVQLPLQQTPTPCNV